MYADPASDGNRTRHPAVLIVPRLRVQNANAISSPMTWGFPAISAFTGFMVALERRLGRDSGIRFQRIGVVCHDYEAQVTTGGYTRAFCLTRNPVLKDGSTAAIVEEGRIHLDVSLIFEVKVADKFRDEDERQQLAQHVTNTLAAMRLAGGSLLPRLPTMTRCSVKPSLELLQMETDKRRLQFRRLTRRCMPGFALVARDDLLKSRLDVLRKTNPQATVLDAWMDLSRITSHAVEHPPKEGSDKLGTIEWIREPRAGWIVPIPVGYAALSDIYASGSVTGARDKTTPFRFVETVWSIGEWISPHRLNDIDDLLWRNDPPNEQGLYRCSNRYLPKPLAALTDLTESFDE